MKMSNPLSLRDPDLFRQQALIGAEWLDAPDDRVLKVTDPASA